METPGIDKSPPVLRRSYILRLWTVSVQGRPVWHAALVGIPAGEQQGFDSLEDLFAYLKTIAASAEPAGEPAGAG